VLTLLELLLVGWVVLLPDLPRREVWLLALAALPFANVVQLALENGAWLLFPVRPTEGQSTPGGMQLGRLYALFGVKFVVLGLLAVPWILGAVLAGPWVALLAGVPTATCACVLLVKLLGAVFRRMEPP